MIYAALSPFILQVGFHLSPVAYGWILSALAISSLLARIFTSSMIGYLGRPRHLHYCIFFFLLINAVFAVFDFVGILGIDAFIALSAMSIFARSAASAVFPSYAMDAFPSKRGVAGSLYGSGQMLISFAISGFVSLFSFDGTVVLVISNLAIAVLMVDLSKLLIKK